MTCFATGSSPNSLVSHIVKSPFVGLSSSPASPLATLSFLNQQIMCHGHSMHNCNLIHQPQLFTVQGGRWLHSTAFFPPSGRLVSPLQTPARLSRISSSIPTYSQRSFTTLSFQPLELLIPSSVLPLSLGSYYNT